MTNTTLQKIQENPNLIRFCNKILSFNAIFENEVARSMFLVSLISADSLVDVHSCNESINISSFLLKHIDLMILEDDVKESVIYHLNKALKIAKRDKKEFIKNAKK